MRAKHEITWKFARQSQTAEKGVKERLLDEVCAITGWSLDNARRQLKIALKPRRVNAKDRRSPALKYTDAAIAVLQRVWASRAESAGSTSLPRWRCN